MQDYVAEDPWRQTSTAELAAALDRDLIEEASVLTGGLLKPKNELSIRRVLVDVASRHGHAKEIIDETFYSEGLVDILSGVIGVKPTPVVWCSVSDSPVSGSWGLLEFRAGSRGYVYYQPDFGVGDDESCPVLGAWEPADDPKVRSECLIRIYTREWANRGLPPYMGQWATGDPELLQEAILRVLDVSVPSWATVFERLADAPEPSEEEPQTIEAVAALSAASPERVLEVMRLVADRNEQFEERLSARADSSEYRRIVIALFLSCIAKDPFLSD